MEGKVSQMVTKAIKAKHSTVGELGMMSENFFHWCNLNYHNQGNFPDKVTFEERSQGNKG